MTKRKPSAKPPKTDSGSNKGVTEQQIIAALWKWGGIKALAAKEVGITRQSMQDRVECSQKLQTVIKQIEDETLDIGEGHIVKGVRDGDKDWTKYYMTAKGRKRGYGNKVETSLDEAQLEAIVASLGGDPAVLKRALLQLGVDPDQT